MSQSAKNDLSAFFEFFFEIFGNHYIAFVHFVEARTIQDQVVEG